MRQFSLQAILLRSLSALLIFQAALLLFAPYCAHAQNIAAVAAIQRITEKKSGAGPWRPTSVGTPLKVEDAFRTGKRSKADIKFADGSLVRLGQLSSVEFRSNKGVQLLGGQLLYAALKPGRVLAGTAAAEIKGSVCVVRLNADNSSDTELFSGAVDVVTPIQQVSLKPGQGVTAFADGHLSPVRSSSPRAFLRGSVRSELLDRPLNTPFVGSPNNELIRIAPERLILDTYEGLSVQSVINSGNPFIPRATRVSPFPPPIPPVLPPSPSPIRRFARLAANENAQPAVAQAVAAQAAPVVQAAPVAIPSSGNTSADTARGIDLVDVLSSSSDTDAAEHHIDEGDRSLGSTFGGDAYIVGLGADGGTALYGARFHVYDTKGKFYFDLAAQPLRVRVGGTTSDYSSIPSANVTYRDRWGDIQAGRQRFIAGPTQATQFGSMVRMGSREIMDAVRFKPALKPGQTLELAYIYDAFPRALPYKIGGAQHGFYGRIGAQKAFGNFGLNVLHYDNSPVSSTTGVTLDFAVPIIRNQLEFYGELGRDPFRRQLRTVGLSFPWLYDRTGFDAFLEYADLNNSGSAAAPPTELAARVYRRVGKNVNVVASVSRFYGTDTNFVLGLAYGGRYTKTGSNYSKPE